MIGKDMPLEGRENTPGGARRHKAQLGGEAELSFVNEDGRSTVYPRQSYGVENFWNHLSPRDLWACVARMSSAASALHPIQQSR